MDGNELKIVFKLLILSLSYLDTIYLEKNICIFSLTCWCTSYFQFD